MTPYSLAEICQRFGGTYWLHLQGLTGDKKADSGCYLLTTSSILKMEALCSSEISTAATGLHGVIHQKRAFGVANIAEDDESSLGELAGSTERLRTGPRGLILATAHEECVMYDHVLVRVTSDTPDLLQMRTKTHQHAKNASYSLFLYSSFI
jgi:hypothetical protein